MDFKDVTVCAICGKKEPCLCNVNLEIAQSKHTLNLCNHIYTLSRDFLYELIEVFR